MVLYVIDEQIYLLRLKDVLNIAYASAKKRIWLHVQSLHLLSEHFHD